MCHLLIKHLVVAIGLFCLTFIATAQQITGVWKGNLGSGLNAKRVELKLVQRGDSLVGIAYYGSKANFTKYFVKGYFSMRNNSIVWWDDVLLETKESKINLNALSKELGMLEMEADFDCPDGGVHKLDGQAKTQNGQTLKLHFEKKGGKTFNDPFDWIIENYGQGGNSFQNIDDATAEVLNNNHQPANNNTAAEEAIKLKDLEEKQRQQELIKKEQEKKEAALKLEQERLIGEEQLKKQQELEKKEQERQLREEQFKKQRELEKKEQEKKEAEQKLELERQLREEQLKKQQELEQKQTAEALRIKLEKEKIEAANKLAEEEKAKLKQEALANKEKLTIRNDPLREIEIIEDKNSLQEKFIQRKKVIASEISLVEDSLLLNFYDNAEVDGDSISLFINGTLFQKNIRLSGNAYIVVIKKADLKKGVNELTMVAENLGAIPPNTSIMICKVNGRRVEALLESTENSSAVIKIIN
jgi:chemotaxis protein histidine kinase CheA